MKYNGGNNGDADTDNNIPESLKKRGRALAKERRVKGFKSEMKQIGKQM